MDPPAFLARRAAPSERPALLADLSGQRHSDPAAFRGRVAWWGRTLADAAWEHIDGNPSLSVRVDADMPTRWALSDAGRPMCVAVAVDELARDGSLVRRPAFVATGGRRSLLSWAWSSAAGALAAAGLVESNDFDEAYLDRALGEWVVVANVKRAAAAYAAHMARHPPGTLDRVQSRAMFARTLESLGIGLVPDDTEVLMRYLERERRILVDGDLVKLGVSGAPSAPTEADRGLLAVRVLHAQLEAQIDELDRRIEGAHARIRAALASKPKSAAMSYLRTRKQLEEMREQRIGALETTTGVLLRIEQAVGDAEHSVRTLRSLLADPALRPEKVDQTMDALAEAAADQADVHNAISVDAGIDDDEIAKELEALALEDAEPQVTLPSAPTNEPERVAEDAAEDAAEGAAEGAAERPEGRAELA